MSGKKSSNPTDTVAASATPARELSERLLTGIRQHQQGKFQAAVEAYRAVLAEAPYHPDALHFLGVAEFQLGQADEALAHITRALAVAPAHPDALNNRGNVHKKLGHLDEAEKDYRAALALRPNDANTLSNLGTVLRQRGDFEAAEKQFRAAIAIKRDHAAAWQNLGNTLHALERVHEALDAQREALRLAPHSAEAFRHLGALLYATGRHDEATDIYRQWLDVFPDDSRAKHFYAASTGKDFPARATDDCVRAEFDHFAENFDAVLARLEYRAPSLIEQALGDLLGAPEPRLDVLDAGCGTGLCGPFLRTRARRLVGVDLSSSMVEQARRRACYDDLVVEELTAYLRAHPGESDLVASADTLVYFGDLTDVIGGAALALRPGGHLVFTVEREPEEAGTSERFRLLPHGRYAHGKGYLARVLGEAGLADLRFEPVNLRKEANRWVEGWLVSARVPGE